MKHWIAAIAALAAFCAASTAFAGQSQCPQFYPRGLAPTFTNQKMAQKTRELCSEGYGVMHSGLTRTPLWSAEYLTREHVEMARNETRTNDFHPDTRLPADERAELSDWRGEHLDRGHLTPAGDAPSDAAMESSFLLSNMVGQSPKMNRGLWSRVEKYTRGIAVKEGAAYVVTGPLFQGQKLRVMKGRVLVPTALYKLIYVPGKQRAFAFVAANTDEVNWTTVSVAQLEQMSGLSFPGIPEQVKNQQPPQVAIR